MQLLSRDADALHLAGSAATQEVNSGCFHGTGRLEQFSSGIEAVSREQSQAHSLHIEHVIVLERVVIETYLLLDRHFTFLRKVEVIDIEIFRRRIHAQNMLAGRERHIRSHIGIRIPAGTRHRNFRHGLAIDRERKGA